MKCQLVVRNGIKLIMNSTKSEHTMDASVPVDGEGDVAPELEANKVFCWCIPRAWDA